MWWTQPWSRTSLSVCVRQAGVGRVAVEVPPPVRQVSAGVEAVRRPVVVAQVPVEVPDVVAPAQDLADEPLGGLQRHVTTAVCVLGRLDDLRRVEEAEVHRGRKEGVGHPRVAGHDCVLVRPEPRQPVRHEVVERRERLGPRRGEPAWAVGTDERDVAVPLPAVQVVPDLGVDVVLRGPKRFADAQGLLAARGRLAVLGVEVPAAPDRFVAVHQHAVATPGVAVEVLQEQPPSTAGLRPRREVLASRHVAAGRQPLDLALVGQGPHEGHRGAGRRLDHLERVVDVGEGVAVPLDARIPAPLPELGGAVPHRAEDEMRLLAVERRPGEDPP